MFFTPKIFLFLFFFYHAVIFTDGNNRTTCTVKPSTPLNTQPEKQILHTELIERIHLLASITENPGSEGTTRTFLSDAGNTARQALMVMMRASGLVARVDAVGNVFGDARCYGEKDNKRKIMLLSSHFDTVNSGGMWDGSYGVLAAIAVTQTIVPRICSFPFDIRVAAFDEEEGASSYGATNFGSRAFAGVLSVANDVRDTSILARRFELMLGKNIKAEDIVDYNNVGSNICKPLNTSSSGTGVQSDTSAIENRLHAARFSDADHFVAALELHIEQGPILENTGHSVAAVVAIAGQTRLTLHWSGTRGHAGTVPMAARRDALAAAAQAVTLVELVGRNDSTDLVTTVGRFDVLNAGSNIISGEVSMSVDVRAAKDEEREQAVTAIINGAHDIAIKRGISVRADITHSIEAVPMSPWLVNVLSEVVDAPTPLVSGAGHDTQFLSHISDVGMLFVRCQGGVSHSPHEFVLEEDAYKGALAMLQAVESVARRINVENL